MERLTERVKGSDAITAANGAAGTTDILGATLDMAGFDAVRMCVNFGVITSGAVTSIKAQQGDASDLSDAADLENTGQTVADTDDGKTFYIDIDYPRKRYVRLYVDRGTQNAVVSYAWYEQYRSGSPVTTQGATWTGETHHAPAEGTA